jgi:mannose-6-phosphate isomerase-like protein (cupin superfamily)
MRGMESLDAAAAFTEPSHGEDTHWVEHLRSEALSVGTYSIRGGGVDGQDPHTEDEIYVVLEGRGHFEAAGKREPVGVGSVLFVPAGEEHRFVDVSEDLVVVVVFAPPEGSRTGDTG